MSMMPDQENFDQLRRLLVLKRYEQPPPGFFNDFSAQVIARIRAGERFDEDSFFDRLRLHAPWLQQIWAALETKPILAGAFGVAVCGLLISGIVYTERVDTTPITAVQTPGPAQFASGFGPGPGAMFPAAANPADSFVPAPATQPSLFQEFKDRYEKPVVQPTTYNNTGAN